ncbi:hypothetical protein ACPPVO_34195 [Dactylosporangium sp. McL0621]|uniref:hypothetical protein n=1 Tax=Dactylosporangium sp. McL0621 TaxID=3415678 RepID=UPI003CFA84DE
MPEPAGPATQVTVIEALPATAVTAGAPGAMLGVASRAALGSELMVPPATATTVMV